MSATTYRFMPWARRGLAARISEPASDGELPQRSKVTVGLTINSVDTHTYDLSIYGPGDVIGIDSRIIVRTDPVANSSDVEPNYFAQIEFDPPDFPWMFTPAKADANEKLRPWCVLLVVDLAKVKEPKTERGKPLPILTIGAQHAASELPDLAESWAWAHTQLLASDDINVNVAEDLLQKPANNVSRLMAPRRLEPGHRYAACLVPAFDAGVERGRNGTLAQAPAPDAKLQPAWQAPFTEDVELPVYFHWTFATGPVGDFETLARRLRPLKGVEGLGAEPLYVSAQELNLPSISPGDQAGVSLDFDGALRSLSRSSAELSEVAADVQDALKAAVDVGFLKANAATGTEPNPRAEAAPYGPPMYGALHSGRPTLGDGAPAWQKDLNLDPRARAAAGLGAEIERQNQEIFMHWSWEQVGKVLEANRLMSRSQLAAEALATLHVKHFASLPPYKLLQLGAPMMIRTKQGDTTVTGKVRASSLPDAMTDPAMRRLASSQRPTFTKLHNRLGVASVPFKGAGLLQKFSTGVLDADPTRFVPAAIKGISGLSSLTISETGDEEVDLTSVGIPIKVNAGLLRQMRGNMTTLASTRGARLIPRANLTTVGFLGEVHLDKVRDSINQPGRLGSGFTVTLGGLVQPTAARSGPRVSIGANDLPPFVKNTEVINRLKASIATIAPGGILGPSPVISTFVPFSLNEASTTLLSRSEPRAMVPKRLASQLALGDKGLFDVSTSGITLSAQQDRVMAAPSIDVPVYAYLAKIAPDRFLPGIASIPDDTLVLLETNPRFIEALMVGLNTEMNRELLWRGFPTDQRGTPFRRFWDWSNGRFDIRPIDQWTQAAALGDNPDDLVPGDPPILSGGQLALLVRGRLLRRYPNSVVLAWKADGDKLKANPNPEDIKSPVFGGVLGSDIAFVGFDLTDADLRTDSGWYFVLQQQPAEPRFGFDEPDPAAAPVVITTWSDVNWANTGTEKGAWLNIASANTLLMAQIASNKLVNHAALFASATMQKPMRVVFKANDLIG